MELTAFRSLIDNAFSARSSRQHGRGKDPQESGHRIDYEFLDSLLGPGETMPNSGAGLYFVVGRLISEIVARHSAYGDSLAPYLWIAEHIRDALRIGATNPGDATPGSKRTHPDWMQAIAYLADHESDSNFAKHSPELIRSVYSRQFALGKAVQDLASAGFVVQIVGDKVDIPECVRAQLEVEIDLLARSVGGLRILEAACTAIAPTFNPLTEHFQLVRRVDASGNNTTLNAQIPWGYAMQLGLKYLYAKGGHFAGDRLARLIRLLTASIAVYDIQPYSPYETMFLATFGVMTYLRDAATYDAIFALPQLRRTHARAMYHGLFNETQRQGVYDGVRFDAVIKIADLVLEMAAMTRMTKVSIHELAGQAGWGIGRTKLLVDRFLAFEHGNVNQELGYPPIYSTVNSMFRPLLKLDDSTYVLLPASVAALATLESLLGFARLIDGSVDQKMGNLIEDFLRRELTKKGIAFTSGKYDFRPARTSRDRHLQSDVDFAIETDEYVVFFEVKKKPLTRLARSGDDVVILSDLAESLVRSQIQAFQHESLLHSVPDFVVFNEAEPERQSRIVLNGRRVARVSVSLLDFDSFQDPASLQKFLEIGCMVQFSHPDVTEQSKLDKVASRFGELRTFAEKVGQFGDPDTRSFSESLFTSVPQLLLVLAHSHDAKSFWTQLSRTRSMFTGSRNFYTDFSRFAQPTPVDTPLPP